MPVAALLLRAIHALYALFLLLHALLTHAVRSLRPAAPYSRPPRIPTHLAILFADPDPASLIPSALSAASWCRAAGIPKLTLYDEHGMSTLLRVPVPCPQLTQP